MLALRPEEFDEANAGNGCQDMSNRSAAEQLLFDYRLVRQFKIFNPFTRLKCQALV